MKKSLPVLRQLFFVMVVCLACVVVMGAVTAAWADPFNLPSIQVTIGDGSDEAGQTSPMLQLLLLFTVLSLAPAILIMLTSFTRIVVVLSLLRNALGTQQIPANQIVIGLSLFLTFFIMGPVWNAVNTEAIQPFVNEELNAEEALQAAMDPLREFMLKHTRDKDLALFIDMSEKPRPASAGEAGLTELIPAFVISELKTAFQIGFMIYIPFLIVDMVVASVLLSMGMLMLPPIMVSLPFKLMLFVLVDGWHLVVGSLVESFY